jgi:nicotinate-nucleotide adenylyltransferase
VKAPHPAQAACAGVDPKDLRLPPAGEGQRVGLFGGSFNPAHAGHRRVAEAALKRLRLDWVWWMVTPGNPLKPGGNRAPLPERIDLARRYADHPRMVVTAFEAAIGTRFTAEVVSYAKARRPDLRFVWLMGADNLATLHRWQRWRDIMRQVPVAVVDRPGARMAAVSAPAARAFAAARLPEHSAARLAATRPPAWVFLHVPLDPTSSTRLRGDGAV